MAGKRNKNGIYITKNKALTKTDKLEEPISKSRIEIFIEKKLVKIIAGAIFTIIITLLTVWFGNYLSNSKTFEADLILKDYRYERETPSYRVYNITFTINNTGNQGLNLIQAVPFDAMDDSSSVSLLYKKSCESYKDSVVEGGKIKDFFMHVFIPKKLIELAKNNEENFLNNNVMYDSETGEVIKRTYSAASINLVAKVIVYGADKNNHGAISTPFKIFYSKGIDVSEPIETVSLKAPRPVDFVVKKDLFYKCPTFESE